MKQLFIFIALTSILMSGCKPTSAPSVESGTLTVFHAGSLSVPLQEMADSFKAGHPGVEILMESAGSVACARKLTDMGRTCDILASADYTVIDEMLIPNYTSWNIKFASNEMAIVYHEGSKYSHEINAGNWYEILLRDDVIFGRSDPNADPCGYRSEMVAQLAETYYQIEGLAKKITAKDNAYIRPKETDLLALLESNTIDYIFLYRSVAQQHGLNYVTLPDSINLKKPELREFYSTASVEINGKTPEEKVTMTGLPMVYGITIPNNATNKELALKFMNFILSADKGMAIMEKNGQPSMIPAYSENYDSIPDALKAFATR